MGRGIIRLDPAKLIKDIGFSGYKIVGARLYEGTVDLIVDSPKIKVEHGKIVELPIRQRKGVGYDEQEDTPSNPLEVK